MIPFDVTIMFQNESGDTSKMVLYDLEFVDEGQVMGINDIFIESTHSFLFRDIEVMHSLTQGPLIESSWVRPNVTYEFDGELNTVIANGGF